MFYFSRSQRLFITRMAGKLISICLLSLLFSTTSIAATLTFVFDHSFGDVSADGDYWLTTNLTDAGAGTVNLTMTVANTVGAADIVQIYFNLDSTLNPNDLSFSRSGGTGPTTANTAITTGADVFKADGDGFYDILFDFDTGGGNGSNAFNAGETLDYVITGIGSLDALDFNFLSLDTGGAGPFLAAAKVQSTGPDPFDGSDWIASDSNLAPIPVPAAVWLFGSALGLLNWTRRKAA